MDSIFLKIVAVPVPPSPPSPESNVVVYSKESLIPGRLWEATLNWGKGFSSRKGVVLEIVLLRRKVDMMGKTFSSSFVRDCSSCLKTANKKIPVSSVFNNSEGLYRTTVCRWLVHRSHYSPRIMRFGSRGRESFFLRYATEMP